MNRTRVSGFSPLLAGFVLFTLTAGSSFGQQSSVPPKLAEAILPESAESEFHAALMMDRADALYEIESRRPESIAQYARVAAEYPQSESAPQALYMAGFAALGLGRYEQAGQHAQAFLAAHEKHSLTPDVTHIAAESLLQLNHPQQAEQLFARLTRDFPDHEDAELWIVRRALALSLLDHHAEAIQTLEPAVSKLRDQDLLAEALFLLGTSAVRVDRLDDAAGWLEASLSTRPIDACIANEQRASSGSPDFQGVGPKQPTIGNATINKWRRADETMLTLAHALARLDRTKEAKATVERLIAEFPSSGVLDQAHYRLGEYCHALDDADAAERAYRRVIQQWPTSTMVPHALHELGCMQLNRVQRAEAEETLSQLVERFPNHKIMARARYARGMVRQQLAKFAPAVDDLQAALAADLDEPIRSDARYLLGLCQLGLEKPGPAAESFRALLEQNPGYRGADNARYQLGWALLLSDRRAEAVAQFARLAKDFPQSPLFAEAQYHIGEFFHDQQDYKKAAVAYRDAMKAAKQTPLGEKAAHKLAWSCYEKGRALQNLAKLDEALETYAEVIAGSSAEPAARAQFMIGKIQVQRKQHSEAVKSFFKVAYGYGYATWQAEARYEAARCFEVLGKKPQAVKMYRELIENHPQSDKVPLAEQRIMELDS